MGIRKDNYGIAPWITLIILGIIGASVIGGTYLVFEKPDITYNITETGFAIFGAEINWFIIIGIIAVIVIVFIWLRPKKQPIPPSQ